MEFPPSSRTDWRWTLAGVFVALFLLCSPYDGGRDLNLLYDLFLHAHLSEGVASLLIGIFALVGGLLIPRRVLQVMVASYGGVVVLLSAADLVWGQGVMNQVGLILLVVGFLVFIYVFGEGKEGRH